MLVRNKKGTNEFGVELNRKTEDLSVII